MRAQHALPVCFCRGTVDVPTYLPIYPSPRLPSPNVYLRIYTHTRTRTSLLFASYAMLCARVHVVPVP
jgi:hypothetical protein